jgi:hypothetical protein
MKSIFAILVLLAFVSTVDAKFKFDKERLVAPLPTDKPMPEPIDFHAPFKYETCGGAFSDIFKQLTLIYGDVYGSQGLNTAFYRMY